MPDGIGGSETKAIYCFAQPAAATFSGWLCAKEEEMCL